MNRPADDFRLIANAIERDIAQGVLKPGEKLLPQREFAYQRGMASSTAGRVYGELRRRGLVTGEVGRGTFVRSIDQQSGAALIDLLQSPINLELVFPALGGVAQDLAAMVADLAGSSDWLDALEPVGADPSAAMQGLVAHFLRHDAWQPEPRNICLTGSGKQAIAAALAGIAAPGSRLGVEALTYPVIKGIAAGRGIELVPLPCDAQGLSLEGLEATLAREPLAALYLQPSLHNPTGATMPASRRAALGRLLQRHDLPVIEDGIYRFLVDEAPLASHAPDHVIVIDSLSKRVSPGLSLGLIAAPQRFVLPIIHAIRQGVWVPSGLQLAVGRRLIESDKLADIMAQRREDAARRQTIARRALAKLKVRGDPRGYHLWLDLPDHWRSEAFVAAVLRHGIALNSGAAFAAKPGHAPHGVRVALASPPLPELERALNLIATIALSPGGDEIE